MKKMLIVVLVILTVLLPVFATANNSKGNTDIPETKVTDVTPEDENEEVIPPDVDIVPDTPEVEELQITMQTVFRLTIYYVYVDGSTAAPTYNATLQAGTEYGVVSPEIEGYTASVSVVAGVMPMRDVEYTVVYLSPEKEEPVFPYSHMPKLSNLGDYETPTGLGFSVSNVGICFE